jgi:uncharacterized protein
MIRFILRLLLTSLFGFLLLVVIIVFSQDAQIFPGAYGESFFAEKGSKQRDKDNLPSGVDSNFIKVAPVKLGGDEIEVWRVSPPKPEKNKVAVLFHGNGGDLGGFLAYQKLFVELGFITYAFDYRGYGLSTGLPSELKMYEDGDAVIEYVKSREGIETDKLLLGGLSIGCGPAAYAALKHRVHKLVLMAPFYSLKDLVKDRPVIGFLSHFTFYSFPVGSYVSGLKETDITVVHGTNDSIVNYHHADRVLNSYNGVGRKKLITLINGSHSVIYHLWEKEKFNELKESLN